MLILIKGTRLSSFPLIDLIDGLTIRYVQSDHKNKEPNIDSFIFHVSDGINESPTSKFSIDIQVSSHKLVEHSTKKIYKIKKLY